MTERYYNDGTEPDVLPHYSRCTGPCDQGRKPCPCPVACESHDESSYYRGLAGLILSGAGVVAVVAAVAFLIGRYA